MRTKTITLYKFNELSDGAQAKAIEEWRTADKGPPAHNDEMSDTIEAFANVFPVSVRRWCYGGDRNDGVDFSMNCNDDVEELKGPRLATYIWNNYKSKLFKGKYRSIETSDKKLEHNRVTAKY